MTSSETLECEVPESDVSNTRVPVVITVNGENLLSTVNMNTLVQLRKT